VKSVIRLIIYVRLLGVLSNFAKMLTGTLARLEGFVWGAQSGAVARY